MDCRPPGSSAHGTFPGENTGVGCHFLLYRTKWVSSKSPSSWIRILRANCLPTECDAALGLASLTKNQQMNLLELVRKGNRFGKWVMCWCQFLKDCHVCALWKRYIWRFILLRKLVFMFCTLQTSWSGKWGYFFFDPHTSYSSCSQGISLFPLLSLVAPALGLIPVLCPVAGDPQQVLGMMLSLMQRTGRIRMWMVDPGPWPPP